MNNEDSPGNRPVTRTEAEGATVDLPEGLGFFSTGQVLGDRYEILEMLGRGGMGEVWRAFDLKLRVEVGLKALRDDLFQSERRLELLRQEVRAAREVVSPNVCRIFDLIEIDGRELVSMEYVDGATLLGVLQERGPLELKEAQDIASQFLSGLEAIHKAGLVHRDVKPENIMLTRAGRVVVMDFGLARGPESGAGSVSGTPAYMAPEHAAGQEVDARADVYSAGVVLAEMVSPEGIKSCESRQSVWEGVRSEPAQVPDSPWASVIQRAVARDRERRPNSAHTLIRELEDVTLRVEGAEDLHPYPGLASFTEDDAEYFFGREAEVEQMWRRLDRPHLMAVVGPSGAGKTSFLRAGLIPSAGPGWGILRCTPGSSPFTSLGQALAREMAGDVEAMELLASGHEQNTLVQAISRWRHRFDHGVLIADQFEELFTHSSNEEQRRFTVLMGRLPVEADTFVLLSMRDDFLLRCREHEALTPVFTDLTALLPPTGGSLRRSIVQPATKCGYRFEDDDLVEEILTEVEGERGALPLLAFALARLWEKRDRETGLLTRQTYHDIGGVGGALARHAEATVDHIGVERIPIVRELFRNLVTAEGTRAVREWDELLSVFGGTSREGVKPSPTKNVDRTIEGADFTPARDAAAEVLGKLIDARLLTSYEVREDEHEPIRRIEIIHESLLANWPRLVRWQTQDQEGAQLRDELRQSARAWDEHDRHDDRLWTGTAYHEFWLWRERYPGGLTETEEAFATSMIVNAGRRRRRRRIAMTSVLVVAVLVAAITMTLWRKSVLSELRAEAQMLIAFGKTELEGYPTAALAYATQSLELTDTEEARFLALQALWEGPTAFIVNKDPTLTAHFSPDGDWLVQTHDGTSKISVISREGDQRIADFPPEYGESRVRTGFGARSDIFLTRGQFADEGRLALWSTPEATLLTSVQPVTEARYYYNGIGIDGNTGAGRAIVARVDDDLVTVDALDANGRSRSLGNFHLATPQASYVCVPKSSGEWLGVVDGNDISMIPVGDGDLLKRVNLGRVEEDLLPYCFADPLGRFFLTYTSCGEADVFSCEISLWEPTGNQPPRNLPFLSDHGLSFSDDGSYLIARHASSDHTLIDFEIWSIDETSFHLRRQFNNIKADGPLNLEPIGLSLATRGPMPASRLWSLSAPAAAEPTVLRSGPTNFNYSPHLSPDGQWVATCDQNGLNLWPLAGPRSSVVRPNVGSWIGGLGFGPEGRYLLISADGSVSVLPFEGTIPPAGDTIFEGDVNLSHVTVSPSGDFFAVGSYSDQVWIGEDDGNDTVELPGTEGSVGLADLAFSPDERYLAALSGFVDMTSAVIRVWDVESSEEIAVLHIGDGEFRKSSNFTNDGRLLTATSKGVLAWDVETSTYETLIEVNAGDVAMSDDGRRLLIVEQSDFGFMQDPAGAPVFYDLESGRSTTLISHGLHIRHMALNREGTVAATGDADGVIRVGPVTGEEPHLLLGHKSGARVAIDPQGRWIVSHDIDTIRLWPMPDLANPPLHTLPREELIAKLKTLTNLRVVRDPESSTGWKLTNDPFPGWKTVPTW